MTPKTVLKTLAALALLLPSAMANAEIKLPEMLGDHCILQQNTDANLWGEAAPFRSDNW